VTIVSREREPLFRDFPQASCAARHFFAPAVQRHCLTLSFVVMPDHVHWLLELKGNLSEAVRLYKAKVSLSLGEKAWQDGYHDHAIRSDEDIKQVARYIVANPLRAGLVSDVGDYPYWDAIWL
jgi:REP element-mobilizing transposase RayT